MLLSFERPGVRSVLASLCDEGRPAGDRLFADLENCTAHITSRFGAASMSQSNLGITDPRTSFGLPSEAFVSRSPSRY